MRVYKLRRRGFDMEDVIEDLHPIDLCSRENNSIRNVLKNHLKSSWNLETQKRTVYSLELEIFFFFFFANTVDLQYYISFKGTAITWIFLCHLSWQVCLVFWGAGWLTPMVRGSHLRSSSLPISLPWRIATHKPACPKGTLCGFLTILQVVKKLERVQNLLILL